MERLSKKEMPNRTKRAIRWTHKLFDDWRISRNDRILCGQVVGQKLSLVTFQLTDLNDDELNFCMCRFLSEVRKQNGQEYPPKTLRQIVLLLQMYLNDNGRLVTFLSDDVFVELRNTLDNLMKESSSRGLGLHVKQAGVSSIEQEEVLWEKGILGSDSPSVLLDTLVYLLGLNFALRSGDEHRNLSIDQFEICVDTSGKYLKYTEKISKTNRRGLKDYTKTRKVVTAYENPRRDRCVVALLEKYMVRPLVAPEALYLRPLAAAKDDRWFSPVAVGVNTLRKTIGDMCTRAEMLKHN